MDIGIGQYWTSLSPFTKWVFGAIGSIGTAGLGFVAKKAVDLYGELYKISTNCVPTISDNTAETRDAVKALSSKMDVLIEVISKKL